MKHTSCPRCYILWDKTEFALLPRYSCPGRCGIDVFAGDGWDVAIRLTIGIYYVDWAPDYTVVLIPRSIPNPYPFDNIQLPLLPYDITLERLEGLLLLK